MIRISDRNGLATIYLLCWIMCRLPGRLWSTSYGSGGGSGVGAEGCEQDPVVTVMPPSASTALGSPVRKLLSWMAVAGYISAILRVALLLPIARQSRIERSSCGIVTEGFFYPPKRRDQKPRFLRALSSASSRTRSSYIVAFSSTS